MLKWFYLLLIIIGLIGIIFFYKFIKKRNFNSHILELILFESNYLFSLPLYYITRNFEISSILSLYSLLLLNIYFIFKAIKTKNYINYIWILVVAINYFLLGLYKPYKFSDGWDLFASFVVSLFLSFVTCLFIIIINIVLFILKKKKKIETKKHNLEKKEILLFIFIIIFSLLMNIFSINFRNYLDKKQEDKIKNFAINYLKSNYGDNDYRVTSVIYTNLCEDCFMFSSSNGYKVTINTDKISKNIEIAVKNKDNKLYIYKDDTLFKYFEDLTGEETYHVDNILSYFKKEKELELDKEILSKFSANAYVFTEFNEKKINNYGFSKLPSLDDIESLITYSINFIKINKTFTIEDKNEFNKYIIEIYTNIYEKIQKPDEEDKRMRFKFEYDNPFVTNKKSEYKTGGYIREQKDKYLIYTDAKPDIIYKTYEN